MSHFMQCLYGAIFRLSVLTLCIIAIIIGIKEAMK